MVGLALELAAAVGSLVGLVDVGADVGISVSLALVDEFWNAGVVTKMVERKVDCCGVLVTKTMDGLIVRLVEDSADVCVARGCVEF
jgi:hypothetical protein